MALPIRFRAARRGATSSEAEEKQPTVVTLFVSFFSLLAAAAADALRSPAMGCVWFWRLDAGPALD